MKIKLLLLLVILFTLQTNAQTAAALQQQNARATGYAIVAARNPGKSFAVLMIKWDGIHDLEHNANSQINPSWHPQAAVKGNFFNQTFDGTDFTMYSSVVVSQAEFDAYKSTGQDWWIVCSTLPTFSNSGLTIADNGNVGVGTATPAALLDIQKTYGNDVGIKLSQPGSAIWDIKNTATSGLFTIGAGGGTYFNIDKTNGNVGIATTTPGYKLDIYTPATATEAYSGINLQSDNFGYLIEGGLKQNAGGILKFSLNTAGAKSEKFRIDQNGHVGIGTTNPDEKLTVKGKIHTEEVKVDLAVPADYVFQKYYTGKSELKSDYVMPTLAEIENFTKKNHHLPNVLSAQEIKQNGLSLGEMSNVLLQKVEELTLYAIEQNKVIEELKTQVFTLIAKKQ